MATASRLKPIVVPGPVTLRRVEWATYCKLRDEPRDFRLRMTYLDGKLTIMSPLYRHDGGSRHIYDVVRTIARVWRIPFVVTGTTTLRREGRTPLEGVGKEPDEGFYFGEDAARVKDNDEIDLAVDPPPSLAIEVDATRNSKATLATYARIGVPEVWSLKARKPNLWFGRLEGEGYVAIDRSLPLPRLTPTLVLQALAGRVRGMDDLDWSFWLDD